MGNREGSISPRGEIKKSENKITKWANEQYLELQKKTKDRMEN